MKKRAKKSQKKTKTTFQAGLLLLLMTLIPQIKPQNATQIGSYKIPSLYLSPSCAKFTESEIKFTTEDLEDGYNHTRTWFKFGRKGVRASLKSKNYDKIFEGYWTSGAHITTNFYLSLLSLALMTLLIIYFFCKGFCGCLFCCFEEEIPENLVDTVEDTADEKKYRAELRKAREERAACLRSPNCVGSLVICSLVSIMTLVLLGGFWGYYGFMTIEGYHRTNCALSYMNSELRFGVNNTNGVFLGFLGLTHLTEKMQEGLNNNAAPNTIGDSVKASDVSALYTSLRTYWEAHKDDSVVSCKGGPTTIQPDVVLSMTATITAEMSREASELSGAVTSYTKMAETTNSAATGNKNDFFGALEVFKTNLRIYDSEVVLLDQDLNDKVETGELLRTYKFIFWVFLIITSLLLVMQLVFMLFSLNVELGAGKSLITSQALLSIAQMFWAFAINFGAVVLLFVGSAAANGCNVVYEGHAKGLDQQILVKDIFKREAIRSLYNVCVNRAGSKDLRDVIVDENTRNKFKDSTQIVDSLLLNISNFNISTTEAPSVTIFKQNLTTQRAFADPGFTRNENLSPETVVSELKEVDAFSCVKDQVVLASSECTLSPVSTTSDAIDKNLNADFCLVATPNGWDSAKNSRYDATCAANRMDNFKNLLACTTAYYNLVGQLQTDIDVADGPKAKFQVLYDGLETAKPGIDTLKQKFASSVEMVDALPNKIAQAMNCSLLQEHYESVLGNLCFRATKTLVYQSWMMAAIGPIMMVLSILVCFSAIQTDRLKDAYGSLEFAKSSPGIQISYRVAGSGGGPGGALRVDTWGAPNSNRAVGSLDGESDRMGVEVTNGGYRGRRPNRGNGA